MSSHGVRGPDYSLDSACERPSPAQAAPTGGLFLSRDGATYNHARDGRRLHRQHHRVLAALRNGAWWTLAELHRQTGDPEASISARLRDLRKPRFGSHLIEREYVQRGLFRYRLNDQAELFS